MDTYPRLMQVALNTCDMVGSLQFYSEVFGFANAGGDAAWGEVMRIQGLDPSERFLIWWMVGRQQSMQLEFFHHSNPAQRPQRADWTPADHGWTRIGIGVPDFDRALAALARFDVTPITAPVRDALGRRVAIRDPYVGMIVEIIEESDALSLGLRHRHFDLDPFIVYAAVSVADLGEARHFFGEVLGLRLSEGSDLHGPEHEALWGLPGAERTCFVADAGDMKLEIVEYRNPRGRPKPADYRISDQGMMNVAIRSTDRQPIYDMIDRAIADGSPPTTIISSDAMMTTYIQATDREIEILGAPIESDAAMGLVPVAPLIGVGMGADLMYDPHHLDRLKKA